MFYDPTWYTYNCLALSTKLNILIYFTSISLNIGVLHHHKFPSHCLHYWLCHFLSFICSLFLHYGLCFYSTLWGAEPCQHVQHQTAYWAMLNCILLPMDGFIQTFLEVWWWKVAPRGNFGNERKCSDTCSISSYIEEKNLNPRCVTWLTWGYVATELKTEIKSPESHSNAL